LSIISDRAIFRSDMRANAQSVFQYELDDAEYHQLSYILKVKSLDILKMHCHIRLLLRMIVELSI